MNKVISTDIQTRFADADSLGHVNNVNLQHYFDVGKMDFYMKVLGKRGVHADSESLVLVSMSANYFAQTRLYDSLAVETSVEAIGTRSVTFRQRLINKATGMVNADCRTVAVAFDFTRQESFPIKDEWRAALTPYLTGHPDCNR